jgi:LuxR family maltose regulon positive regulatory protein
VPSTALLNDLSAVSEDVVLVLDDDHVIRARDVQDEVASLLENRRPPQLRVVASKRVLTAALTCRWRRPS